MRATGVWSLPHSSISARALSAPEGMVVPLIAPVAKWAAPMRSGACGAAATSTLPRSRSRSPALPAALGTRRRGSSSTPRRQDLPLTPVPGNQQQRGQLPIAIAVLGDEGALEAAVASLRAGFYANSSREAVSAKRRVILDLAVRASKGAPVFPLSEVTVVRIAAALHAAEYRSGPSYMAELRLMHIERGHAIQLWLQRLLFQIKNSLSRGIGPADKAPEVRFEDCVDHAHLIGPGSSDLEALADPWRSFVIACRFLLREIELANVCLAHVDFSGLPHVPGELIVFLFIPVSKTDVGGTGAKRALRCSCSLDGWDGKACAAHTLHEQAADIEARAGTLRSEARAHEVPLFPTVAGEVPSKAAVINGWASLVKVGGPRPRGHSARRAGAKRYARANWSASCIQHIGRWAGPTVLGYIEEAYAELPLDAAAACRHGEDAALPALASRVAAVEKVHSVLQVSIAGHLRVAARCAEEVAAQDILGRATENATPKWVLPGGSGKIHLMASFSLSTPSWAWRTVCGWRFANAASGFVLLDTLSPSDESRLCERCPCPAPILK
jgi:hypothetical protein